MHFYFTEKGLYYSSGTPRVDIDCEPYFLVRILNQLQYGWKDEGEQQSS
jgi:hypothetical protein